MMALSGQTVSNGSFIIYYRNTPPSAHTTVSPAHCPSPTKQSLPRGTHLPWGVHGPFGQLLPGLQCLSTKVCVGV